MSPKLQLLSPTFLRSSNCSPSVWSVVVWFQRDSVLWHSCNFGDGTYQRVQSLMFMMMMMMMLNVMFNALIYISFMLMTCILDPSSPSFTFWQNKHLFLASICVSGETWNCNPPPSKYGPACCGACDLCQTCFICKYLCHCGCVASSIICICSAPKFCFALGPEVS